MKRKKRYRKRYKSYKRRKRSRGYLGRGNATEVKYLTLVSQNQSSVLAISDANNATLYAVQRFLANLLENISVGNTFTTRVGNKIYVMSINVKFYVYGCTAGTDYNVDNFLIRHIWHNQRVGTGSDISNFFGNSSTINFNSFVDRKSTTVHKDRTYSVQAGAFANTNTGTSRICGACREINYSIPVNRYVTYTPSGAVKEDRDVYSLAVLVASPGMSFSNNLLQVACWQAKYRIYYKDA